MNARFFTTILAVTAAFAMATAGCAKDQKSTAVTEPVASEAPPAPLYAAFPSAANVVVGIDVQGILASPLGQKIKPMLAQNTSLTKMNEACGFDVLSKVETVSIGADTEKPDDVLVALRGFTGDDFKACAAGITAAGKTATYEEDGQLAKVAFAESAAATSPKTTWIYWTDPRTLMFGEPATGADGKTWIEGKAAASPKLADSASFKSLLADVDTSKHVWVAAFAEEQPIDIAGHVQNLHGTVDVTEGLVIDFAVHYGSADEAASAAKQIGMYKQMASSQPGIGPLAAKLSVTTEGSDMAINGTWTAQEVEGVVQMMMMSFGAARQSAPPAGPAVEVPSQEAPAPAATPTE